MGRQRTGRNRVGRPPAGADGQRVRDYPQISVRVPHAVRATFDALARKTGLPRVQVIARALECLQRDLARRARRQKGHGRRSPLAWSPSET